MIPRHRRLIGLSLGLDLGIEIEERLQTGTKLLLDLLFTALEQVHRDVRLASIREFHRSLADLDHVFGGKQPHAVDQRQICHTSILRRSRRPSRQCGAFENLEFGALSFRIPACPEFRYSNYPSAWLRSFARPG